MRFNLWLDLKSEAESFWGPAFIYCRQCRFVSEGNDCILYRIVLTVQTISWVLPSESTCWCVGLCWGCGLRAVFFPELMNLRPRRLAPAAMRQRPPQQYRLMFCAVIGLSWNIMFYLIVCSPATQTPISQKQMWGLKGKKNKKHHY